MRPGRESGPAGAVLRWQKQEARPVWAARSHAAASRSSACAHHARAPVDRQRPDPPASTVVGATNASTLRHQPGHGGTPSAATASGGPRGSCGAARLRLDQGDARRAAASRATSPGPAPTCSPPPRTSKVPAAAPRADHLSPDTDCCECGRVSGTHLSCPHPCRTGSCLWHGTRPLRTHRTCSGRSVSGSGRYRTDTRRTCQRRLRPPSIEQIIPKEGASPGHPVLYPAGSALSRHSSGTGNRADGSPITDLVVAASRPLPRQESQPTKDVSPVRAVDWLW